MLFYETFGSTSLKNPHPLVFLHGFLGSRLDWSPIVEVLKKEYLCITIDLPSHGHSGFSKHPFKSLEETLHVFKRPILIGYSLGGRLCLKYGRKHPEKITSLIAISSHIGLKTSIEKKKRHQSDLLWQERFKTLQPQDFLTLWYDQPIFSSLQQKPELLKNFLTKREYQNPQELSDLLMQFSLARQPLYKKFYHKATFLFGEEDNLYEMLYLNLPCPVKKIKAAGHAAHLENPEGCIEAILQAT